MSAEPRSLKHGLQEGNHRALSIGARHMDDRRQPSFRIAERGQQAFGPAQGQIDQLGMKPGQPIKDGVTPQGRSPPPRAPVAAPMPPNFLAGSPADR